MPNTDKIHIFKVGRHVASDGVVHEFTEEMLRASAAAYDPAKHEAPIVIGHPKHNTPAYGWAKSLSFAAPDLEAEPQQLAPEFVEWHRSGRVKKISASWYAPDSPQNPVPGVYYLRHIGFLGAQPPAVKGLRQSEFAEAEEGVIDFADWGDMQNASLWRRLRDWIIGKDGLDEADKVIPGYAVASLEALARRNDGATPNNYEEDDMKTAAEIAAEKLALDKRAEEVSAQEAALRKQAAEFAEREKAVKAAEAATRRAAIVDFVGELVKDGKLLPRDKDGLIAFMAGPNEAGVIEFGEGDDKKSVAPDAWLKTFLEGLPKQVDYAERTPADNKDTGTVSFAAPPGYSVDPARLELHGKALDYQAQHPNTTYDAAIAAVSR